MKTKLTVTKIMRNRIKSYIASFLPKTDNQYILIKKLLNSSSRDKEKVLIQNGKLLSHAQQNWKIEKLSDSEFQVFSQWGDDGIIQYLIQKIKPKPIFIEFGVEDYQESNTRFLLHNNNWKGLVIDGSEKHIKKIKNSDEYWKFDLTAVCSFITKENINQIFIDHSFQGEVGILSIDIDGNDYWVWKSIEAVNPEIIITEYNSVFGPNRTITIPYNANFMRIDGHYSYLYWGASLGAFVQLSQEKGYTFVGTNSAGNNAYFVRNDKMVFLPDLTKNYEFVYSKYRESRDPSGKLTFLSGSERINIISGLPIYNTTTNSIEVL
jgi:hypothetical protein